MSPRSDDVADARADRWLEELAALRGLPDDAPAERRAMRLFLRKTPPPSIAAQLVEPPTNPVIEYGTVALYGSLEPGVRADVLVPIAAEDCAYLPLAGHVDVRGVIAVGHAVTLTSESRTVACSGPLFVPLWIRRYRNRPQRWPPFGPWSAEAGSAVRRR